MNVQFRASFAKDLQRIKDQNLLKRIQESVEQVEAAHTLYDVSDTKKLKKGKTYYRIRVGDYRIGIIVERDMVTFVRCIHRKEIYRYFP